MHEAVGGNAERPASLPVTLQLLERLERAFAPSRDGTLGVRPSRRLPYSLRPMKVTDVARAMRIAADNFRGEVGLVARSYLWHFSRRAGLGGFGSMWSKRVLTVAADHGAPASIEVLSSFVHDRDVAWIDLGAQPDRTVDLALDAIRAWPRRHRLLIVRVDRARAPMFLDAGFQPAGEMPDGDGGHVYLHADRERVADAGGAKPKLRFGRRRRVASDCEFSVVERENAIVGLTGIYQAGFWRGVTWGAWGAMDRASARRDAVFETLRLTEERARATGAGWFCLETSDDAKYRHARRIYELYGLQLMLSVPNFYRGADGASEALMVYGKPLTDDAAGSSAAWMPARNDRLAA